MGSQSSRLSQKIPAMRLSGTVLVSTAQLFWLSSADNLSHPSSESHAGEDILHERKSYGGYLDTSTYNGGFGASSELGFTRGEGDFSGGEGGIYPGYDSAGGYPGYDYDSDVASLTQTDVMAEERTNFGYGGGHGGGYGSSHGGGYSGGHGKGTGTGTACIVKGSYCNCHYCKCEKGHISCGHGHGYGKKYCYGGMEGEYCHCDYCKVFPPSLNLLSSFIF